MTVPSAVDWLLQHSTDELKRLVEERTLTPEERAWLFAGALLPGDTPDELVNAYAALALACDWLQRAEQNADALTSEQRELAARLLAGALELVRQLAAQQKLKSESWLFITHTRKQESDS